METIYLSANDFSILLAKLEKNVASYSYHFGVGGSSYDDYYEGEGPEDVRVCCETSSQDFSNGAKRSGGWVTYVTREQMDYINHWLQEFTSGTVERHRTLNGNYLCYCHADGTAWYEDRHRHWTSTIDTSENFTAAKDAVRWARSWGKDYLSLNQWQRVQYQRWRKAKKAMEDAEHGNAGLFEQLARK